MARKPSSNPSGQGSAQERVYSGGGDDGTWGAVWLEEQAGDRQRHEVSVAAAVVVRIANAARRSAERFQGKNGWMSSGAFPPASAQLAKYHVSHRCRLSLQWASVANNENILAANRPLHNEPDP